MEYKQGPMVLTFVMNNLVLFLRLHNTTYILCDYFFCLWDKGDVVGLNGHDFSAFVTSQVHFCCILFEGERERDIIV